MLVVCASSTTEALTTAQALMELLGTTATSCSGWFAECERMVLRATATVETFVGYPLRAQCYQETLPAYGGQTLAVSRTPIRAVLRVFDATDTGTATELTSTEYRVESADAGFIQRDEGFAWTAQSQWALAEFVVPGSETRPWLIEYGAGYVGPLQTLSTDFGTTSTGRDLPYDIEAAVLETAKTLYLTRSMNSDVTSKRIGDLSISYRSESGTGSLSAGALPQAAAALLRPYRRLA